MSLINLRDRTINAKIVYYGTALSGKTTSLQYVHTVVDPEGRTELVSLNTQGDRTLFFDFLPIPLGNLGGFQVKLQAFTVPGQVKYAVTRRYVLRGADGVVFVADSRRKAFDDNLVALRGLRENLTANGLDAEKIPLLIQYNKRDLDDIVPEEELREALNWRGARDYPTVATTGPGVFESFTGLCCDLLEGLAREYRIADPDEMREELSVRLDGLRQIHEVRRLEGDANASAAPIGEQAAALAAPADASQRLGGESQVSVITIADPDIDDEAPDLEELLEKAVASNMESAKLVADLHETRRTLSDHVRQLATLHETGVLISSELDAERSFERILEKALATVGATHGSVILRHPETGQLSARMLRGYESDPLVGGAEPEPEFVGRILHGRPFYVEASEAPWMSVHQGELPPFAALVAPLLHQGEGIGALVAYRHDAPRDGETESRLRFLGAVAGQAAVALVNARLFARVEGFNRELERKVAERTRELEEAYRELKALDALKDDFLASMSHELLTPLTSIGGFAEILVTTAADDGEAAAAERTEFATIVQQESGRLTHMLQAVLDLSMLEAGQVQIAREAIDMRELVQDAYRSQQEAFRTRGARVRVRVEDDIPAALGDRAWLGRVAQELLSNACKFSPDGAPVIVTVRRIDAMIVVAARSGSTRRTPGARSSRSRCTRRPRTPPSADRRSFVRLTTLAPDRGGAGMLPRAVRVLLVDNYDSFTYNLVQALRALGAEVLVRRNDAVDAAGALELSPAAIVISPGPCTPAEAGVSVELVKAAADRGVPLLGVCLGHQAIGVAMGGSVSAAARLRHGKTSLVTHSGGRLYEGLSDPFQAMRYHSLVVDQPLPYPLEPTAWVERDDGPDELMGFRHRDLPIAGVQFHPESYLTPEGPQLLANFLAMAREPRR